MPWAHSEGFLNDFRAVEDPITDHPFEGDDDMIAYLSYFEHGLCRWGLGGTMRWMPDFRWDGASLAGLLIFKPEDERDWWDGLDEEKQTQIISDFLDNYTAWCNGETYYVEVQEYIEREVDPCPHCGHNQNEPSDWEETDIGYGGVIGDEGVTDAIKEQLPNGVSIDDVEVIERY